MEVLRYRVHRVEKSCQVWIVVPICSLGHSMHKSIYKSHRFFSLKNCFHFILNVIHLLWQDTLAFSWQRMCGGCRKRTGGLLLGKESEKSKSLPNPKAADGPWCVSWSISWSRYAFLPSRKSRFSMHKAASRCVINLFKALRYTKIGEYTHATGRPPTEWGDRFLRPVLHFQGTIHHLPSQQFCLHQIESVVLWCSLMLVPNQKTVCKTDMIFD